ncbi:MAG: cyclase family protein [Planctomycetia bacterium]|jgi:kynurenine formamidase
MIIDLSHPLEHGQPVFPGDPEIEVVECGDLASCGYHITRLGMSTHQGTHLDAPFHFYDDGATVDQIPLEKLYGPAMLVDLAAGDELPSKTPITVDMLTPHESKFSPGAKVVCRTGWDRKFGTPEFFTDGPSFTIEAIQWITARRIDLLGMDMPSPSEAWQEAHQTLLKPGAEIVIVESMANLDRLPEQFMLAVFPLRITGRDGSPVRAVGIVDE